jgi:hypothetical protein
MRSSTIAKIKGMSWTEYIPNMREMRNAYKVLARKPIRKRSFWKSKHR